MNLLAIFFCGIACFINADAAQVAITFNKDVAPILFKQCAACHRPGRAGPFSLLTYEDARKHEKEIVKLTRDRVMPPWLAKEPAGTFKNERLLSTSEIETFSAWVAQGSTEGLAKDRPPRPNWKDDWELGRPDQILTLPDPFHLRPDGRDVYRNFVMHVSNSTPQFVRAVEIRPGSSSGHHAFLLVDDTPQSRVLDAKDPEPGFDGMYLPVNAHTPGGQFLSWQPGRGACQSGEGFAWLLKRETDLMLQLHMRPTGKPELVRPTIGLYFTNAPPIASLYKITLGSADIDIPAGATNYEVADSYKLPVEVELRAIHPHSHYLAKRMSAMARFPDGSERRLLTIDDWDFNWQSDFQFVRPVRLPIGTTITMRITFDNSESNPRNPNHPPVRTQFGSNTTDEMAEMYWQVRPKNKSDLELLQRDHEPKLLGWNTKVYLKRIETDPRDFMAQIRLGLMYMIQEKYSESERHLRAGIDIDPNYDEGHYYLALNYRLNKKFSASITEFEAAVKANPQNFKAHGNLGVMYMDNKQWDKAELHFREALRIQPDDKLSMDNLRATLARKEKERKP